MDNITNSNVDTPVKLKLELDGRVVEYTPDTVFQVQVGRFKGSYKPKASFTGNFSAALIQYHGTNVDTDNGFKKRLVAFEPSDDKSLKVLARTK